MKKAALIFFICVFTATFVPEMAAAAEHEPEIEAQAAILMDYKTGRVLWEKNSRLPLAMASTTKIMTAILAIERGNLSDTVTVSKNASLAPDVQMNLVSGEEIALKDLLYAIMMVSANDAAVAIAEHIAGDVTSFCEMMTDKARELGAGDTVFETPNGLDKGEHHSTAYDMGLIACYALNNPTFMDIINTKSITVSSSKRSYSLNNTNRLLYGFEGGLGVKTGFTGKAGHCFVGAAKRGDMQLISVVLASGWGNRGKERKWTDTGNLLNYGFQNYKYEQIIDKGQTAGNMSVKRSKTETLGYGYSDGLLLPLSESEKNNVDIEIIAPEEINAPVNEGDEVGMAVVSISGQKCAEIPLIAEGGAVRHDLKTSMEKVITGWLSLGTSGDVKLILPEF